MIQLMLEARVNSEKIIDENEDATFDSFPNYQGKHSKKENLILNNQLLSFVIYPNFCLEKKNTWYVYLWKNILA